LIVKLIFLKIFGINNLVLLIIFFSFFFMDFGSKITVVVRKRPLGKKELARGETDIVDVRDDATVVVKEIKLLLNFF
jgi:hypothetical protein